MTRRLPADEFISEVEWLVEGGVHPTHVARALHTTVHAIEKRLYRAGRDDLARVFRNESKIARKAA